MTSPEKIEQEKRPLNKLNDSFKKFVIIKDDIKTSIDENGLITIGIYDFLLNENSLETYDTDKIKCPKLNLGYFLHILGKIQIKMGFLQQFDGCKIAQNIIFNKYYVIAEEIFAVYRFFLQLLYLIYTPRHCINTAATKK